MYQLSAARQYEVREGSICFPQFPIAQVVNVLRQVNTASETALVRSFRDWVRTNFVRPAE